MLHALAPLGHCGGGMRLWGGQEDRPWRKQWGGGPARAFPLNQPGRVHQTRKMLQSSCNALT
jgi:hypothetical protein